MPTERFYRLAPEKQEIIRSAAFEEFAGVPVEKVSINRIIQKADISRGSFYTYFEDKDDLLYYILKDVADQMRKLLEREVEESGGDVFVVLERFFDAAVETCSREDWFAFGHNVMDYVNPEEALHQVGIMDQSDANLDRYLYEHVDLSGFRSRNQEDFSVFLEVAAAAMMVSIRKLYGGIPLEKIRSDYGKMLALLKAGVCSEGQDGRRESRGRVSTMRQEEVQA